MSLILISDPSYKPFVYCWFLLPKLIKLNWLLVDWMFKRRYFGTNRPKLTWSWSFEYEIDPILKRFLNWTDQNWITCNQFDPNWPILDQIKPNRPKCQSFQNQINGQRWKLTFWVDLNRKCQQLTKYWAILVTKNWSQLLWFLGHSWPPLGIFRDL